MYTMEKENGIYYILHNGKRTVKFEKYGNKGYIKYIWNDASEYWHNPYYHGWFKTVKAIKAYYKIDQ